MIRRADQKGFSLLELVVAVSIILIMTAVAFISYDTITANARDAVRINHVNDIGMAFQMYADEHGHMIGRNSGCGYEGHGTGWFNHGGSYGDTEPGSDPYYPDESLMGCLIESGVVNDVIIDPTGKTGFSAVDSHLPKNSAYVKYNCTASPRPTEIIVMAKLEQVATEDRMEPNFNCEETNNTVMRQVINHYDRYEMNYWKKFTVL